MTLAAIQAEFNADVAYFNAKVQAAVKAKPSLMVIEQSAESVSERQANELRFTWSVQKSLTATSVMFADYVEFIGDGFVLSLYQGRWVISRHGVILGYLPCRVTAGKAAQKVRHYLSLRGNMPVKAALDAVRQFGGRYE